jgi:hypothetical protein
VKFNTLLNLLRNRFAGTAVAGVKRIVITVGTTSNANSAIAIGAGKPRIDGKLLNPATKGFLYVIGKAVKPSFVAPRVHFCEVQMWVVTFLFIQKLVLVDILRF